MSQSAMQLGAPLRWLRHEAEAAINADGADGASWVRRWKNPRNQAAQELKKASRLWQ